jgi:hypothetical protein
VNSNLITQVDDVEDETEAIDLVDHAADTP